MTLSYDSTLKECIHRVLEDEAPILDKALVDRVARAHGFKRSGRLIRERVLELAERSYHFQPGLEPEHGDFVWLSAEDVDRWSIFRIPERDEDVRFVEELAPEEIVAAARTVWGDERELEIARVFGIRRLSAAAKNRLTQVIDRDANKNQARP